MKLRAIFIVICSVSVCTYTTCVHGAAVAGTVIEVLDGDTVRIMSNRRLPHGQHAHVIAQENKVIADKRAIVTTYEVAGEDARYIRYYYPDSGREQWYAFQTVRLDGIDAPELSQPGGNEARAALAAKVGDRRVIVTAHQHDEYGRIVGRVADASGRDVATEMVREGHAYHYHHYSSNPGLAAAEQAARSSKRGVWAASEQEKPWEYRRRTANTTGTARARVRDKVTGARARVSDYADVRRSSSQHNKVYVRGYARADGTQVKGYWRSTPTRASGSVGTSGSSGQRSSAGGTVRVSGYYRANGTYVQGYTRTAASRGGGRGR